MAAAESDQLWCSACFAPFLVEGEEFWFSWHEVDAFLSDWLATVLPPLEAVLTAAEVWEELEALRGQLTASAQLAPA